MKTKGEDGHLQVKERGLRMKSMLLTPCSQTSNIQNCEKINLLSHQVSGVFVWQSSKLIHRGSSMMNPCAPITQLQQLSNIWPILFHSIAFFFPHVILLLTTSVCLLTDLILKEHNHHVFQTKLIIS